MADLRFITLHVSPWSERARWALDHHSLSYREEKHVVGLGNRKLSRITGKRRNTVPILVADGVVLTDSTDIARYADRQGTAPPLFPTAHASEIEAWTKRADRVSEAGRGILVRRLADDPAALDESLPRAIPRPLRPLMRPVARAVTRAMARKYGVVDPAREAEEKATVRAGLDQIRALGLSRRTVFETFSYADIVIASTLQGIAPVADAYLKLGPATRRRWTRAELAAEYADLVAWRDWLYDSYRRRPSR